MKRLLEFLPRSASSLVTIAVLALIAVVIFTFGSSLHFGETSPLGSMGDKLIAALALPTVWLVSSLVQQRTTQYLNSKVTSALNQIGFSGTSAVPQQADARRTATPAPTKGRREDARDEQAMASRFKTALAVLRKRRFSSAKGRRWLYQLPWYVMIGPPGSGKTTAITNSGLTFPLADKTGRLSLAGIGGTRNCDWWFTDEAVMIDTAGRYTLQENDEKTDKTEWSGLLKLLKRHRRWQPINGILVTVSISDVTSENMELRLLHASGIRARIMDMYRELRIRVPVYVLVTKADLIAGFVEYFDDLGREGREAVWGFTLPFSEDEGRGAVALFEPEFAALAARLDERLLERVQQEGDLQRRALVFGFPQQVASLKEMMAQFLKDIFESNTFEVPIFLRGVYLVSGAQFGTPQDRIMSAVSRTFGVSPKQQPSFVGNGRSYFLTRFLRDVAFAEAWLVEADNRIARHLRRLHLAVLVGIACATLSLGALWVAGYSRDRAAISKLTAAVDVYEKKTTLLKLDPVADADLREVAPLLDQLRSLKADFADLDLSPRWLDFIGFHQRTKVEAGLGAAYHHALETILLPRMILRLEDQMRTRSEDPAFLHPALEVYLVLGIQGPLETDFIKRWMDVDWTHAYPGNENIGLRNALQWHLSSLLSAPFRTVGLDGALVERTRAVLRKLAPAQEVVDQIVTSPQAAQLPFWRVSDVSGPMANNVLRLRSGPGLSDGIPGIYTRDGFNGVFRKMLPLAADAVVARSWILDSNKAPGLRDADLSRQLQRDATGLYLQDFVLRWDNLINQVVVQRITSFEDALRTLNILASPYSPIRLLVAAVADQTSLDPAQTKSSSAAGGDRSAAPTPSKVDTLSALFKSEPAALDSPEAMANSYTQEHFRSLHDLFRTPPNSGPNARLPIDTAIGGLETLYRSLTSEASDQQSPLQQSDRNANAIARLKAEAASLPDPIRHWVLGVSETSSDLSFDRAKSQLATLWNGGPGRLCQQVTTNRYPFVKGVAEDVPLGDFGRLLGPAGTIDAFFTKNLAPYVDTAQSPWKMLARATTDGMIDDTALKQFQRAQMIRDGMFAGGGNTPALDYELSITDLDAATRSVAVDVAGQHLAFSHETTTASMRMRWPASSATDTASITFTPGLFASPVTIAASGPWALFRLLDKGGDRRRAGADQIQVRFAASGHTARITIRADSVINPFDGALLSQFRCPNTF